MMSGKAVHSLAEVQIGDTLGPGAAVRPQGPGARLLRRRRAAGVPRFTDDELARKEGLPGMITPGNMSAALIGKLVERLGAGRPREAGPAWHHLSQSGAART